MHTHVLIENAARAHSQAAAAAPLCLSLLGLPLARTTKMDGFVTRDGKAPLAAQPAAAKTPGAASSGVKRTRVPDDLSSISRGALEGLVKELAAERDLLERTSKRPAVATTPTTSSAASAPAAPTDAQVRQVLMRLADKSKKAIKKTKHNDKRKPYTEVTEGVPTKALALALLRGQEAHQKSDTARMTRWVFESGPTAASWLGIERTIHPVAFDGKVWCFAGQRPSIYAHAGIESLEVKYELSANLLTLKFRTYLAGTGRPGCFDDDDY
jgi:hypothetical protein